MRATAAAKSIAPKIIIRGAGANDYSSRGMLPISGLEDYIKYQKLARVDNINIDHKLQLLLYAWLWGNSDLYKKYGSRDFKLLNIKTGELLKLVNDQYKINQITI